MRPSGPPLVLPARPRGSARRSRRARVAAVVALAVVLLVALGAAGAAWVVARHPSAPARLRALAANKLGRARALLPGGPEAFGVAGPAGPRPARLACTPAIAPGARGELRTVAQLAAGERATAVFQWPAGRAGAGAERGALRALATGRGLTAAPLGRRGAVAITADGATLRALVARAPSAPPQLAAAGTRELCVLD